MDHKQVESKGGLDQVRRDPPNELDQDAASIATPTPVATPCRRSEVSTPGSLDSSDIPVMGAPGTKAPNPGELRLTENAINLRLRRVFQPNPKTGEFRVADNIRNMFLDKKGKGGKKKLLQVFQSCGYDPDRVMSKNSVI